MTPRSLLRMTAERFRKAGIPDPETDSALLLAFLTGRAPLSLRLDTDTELPPDLLDAFASMADRRLDREPLQYITGETHFFGRTFFTDRRVLIPRPETEQLCAWALETLPLSGSCAVLDLCCGSGCIGLTLAAERTSFRITLADLSFSALEVAEINAARLGLRASFHQGNLTDGLPGASFDCVISNPPYIPSADCSSLQPEVLREPLSALDGGEDGLVFYRRIAAEVPRILRPGGLLMLELGYGEAAEVSALLGSSGFSELEIRKDFSGISRMIRAVYSKGRDYVR